MIALQIEDIKQFMLHLFSKNTFDEFWLSEAKIKMGVSYEVNGFLNKEFYDSQEWEELKHRQYTKWVEQKQIVFSMIRGHKTPDSMQIVFMLPKARVDSMILQNNLPISLEEIRGLFLNIQYKNKQLLVTTGVSMKSFSLDKTIQRVWEEEVVCFLQQNKISSQEI